MFQRFYSGISPNGPPEFAARTFYKTSFIFSYTHIKHDDYILLAFYFCMFLNDNPTIFEIHLYLAGVYDLAHKPLINADKSTISVLPNSKIIKL